ncbi:MAG: sortase [Candidatus Moraniibacteriota bacterium]
MWYDDIAYVDNKGNFHFISQNKGFRYWSKKIWPILIIPVTFLVIFIIVNIDLQNAGYFLKSNFSKNSARKMAISKEWMQKYNIILTDKLYINDDIDLDGLTFKDEARFNTNPFGADTDTDGTNDGYEIKNGTNPLGSGELDNNHNKIPDKWEKQFGLSEKNDDANQDGDNDGLKNINEYLHGTNPLKADTDGDGYNDAIEIKNGYDPDAQDNPKARVLVLSDKIGLAAPMVWSTSTDEKILEKDLERGVVHYPSSGVPGQNGNVIISGHSSNYVWAKGEYNSVFKNINKLSEGDEIVVRISQQNGKVFDYKYKIIEKRTLDGSNDWIFQDFPDEQILTLSTCWPIGTDISRLVIRAKREIW